MIKIARVARIRQAIAALDTGKLQVLRSHLDALHEELSHEHTFINPEILFDAYTRLVRQAPHPQVYAVETYGAAFLNADDLTPEFKKRMCQWLYEHFDRSVSTLWKQYLDGGYRPINPDLDEDE